MLIPSVFPANFVEAASLSRRVNANSQRLLEKYLYLYKLIKKGEC